MEKFIRTENGIYELKDNMSIEIGVYNFFGKIHNTGKKHLFRNDKDLGEFVSEADTIEELCDEFVAVRENASGNNTNFFIEFEDWKVWISGYDIYGAIWTDEGLKYVIKMNEEGDWKLL